MIEELNRFIQVAKHGNITKTAEKLFITQSALTQSLQRLEKALDTKLFIQQGKIRHLTSDGAAILQLGTKIVELWERAQDKKQRTAIRITYAIGAFDNVALNLGKYFQQVTNDNTMHLEISIDSSEKLLTKLRLGILDIAICVLDPQEKKDPNIILVKTFSETLLPVATHNRKEAITTIPFILYNKQSHTRKHIDELFFQKGFSPNIFAESTSVTFMKKLAILGCGVAFLPENEVKSELKQKVLRRQHLPFTIKRTFGIYIRKDGAIQKDHPLISDLIHNLK